MYGKIFASLYQGTLRGRAAEILVFTNMIACCDKDGEVDKHPRAIADEVGLPVDQVNAAIATLEAPDHESRSRDHDGARIIRVSTERTWGWRIVNHSKYRAIRNEDDRREQNRAAAERHRAKKSADVSQGKPTSAEKSPVRSQESEVKSQKSEPIQKDMADKSATPDVGDGSTSDEVTYSKLAAKLLRKNEYKISGPARGAKKALVHLLKNWYAPDIHAYLQQQDGSLWPDKLVETAEKWLSGARDQVPTKCPYDQSHPKFYDWHASRIAREQAEASA